MVVGGGTMGTVLFSPSRSWNGSSRELHDYRVGLLGPFVDYTFVESIGLHAQLLMGLANVAENGSGSTTTTAWGFGVSLGLGVGTWVSRTLCLGVLFRGQLAHVSTSRTENAYGGSPGNPDLLGIGVNESQTLFSGGLLVDLT